MMNILVINGPNLNLLGIREQEIYGRVSYNELKGLIKKWADELDLRVKVYQSNHEGEIIDIIQSAINIVDGIIINAGGYSHTSVAILDALKAVKIPTVEVHISDITKREEFRKFSYISLVAQKSYIGLGINGYYEALSYFKNLRGESKW